MVRSYNFSTFHIFTLIHHLSCVNIYLSLYVYGTLMSCFKAFECLGFSVTGAQISRPDALAHLMSSVDEAKRKRVEGLWETLTSFWHLGRHDRGAPVQLTHADCELAVVSTTMLLSYLAAP
jgi:hypothetical protein